MPTSIERRLRRHHKILIGLGVAALLILVGTAFFYFRAFNNGLAPDQAIWGQFGDYMGGVLNPLFSLVALLALFFTITLQVRELDETREELHQTTLAARQQTFENTFFQMLSQQRQISESWQVSISTGSSTSRVERVYTGNKARFELSWLWARHFHETGHLPEYPSEIEVSTELARVLALWEAYLKSQYGQLGNFFRSVYAVLNYVDVSTLAFDKQEFANIVRAQTSPDEIYLLFYDALLPINAHAKSLLEKYHFFENFNSGMGTKSQFLPIPNAHYLFYDKSAYGSTIPKAFSSTLSARQVTS